MDLSSWLWYVVLYRKKRGIVMSNPISLSFFFSSLSSSLSSKTKAFYSPKKLLSRLFHGRWITALSKYRSCNELFDLYLQIRHPNTGTYFLKLQKLSEVELTSVKSSLNLHAFSDFEVILRMSDQLCNNSGFLHPPHCYRDRLRKLLLPFPPSISKKPAMIMFT